MKNLLATLYDYDPGMLPILAEVWSIDRKRLNAEEVIRRLQSAMLDPQQAEAAWDKLPETARAALRFLVSSADRRMKVSQFERVYGKIRKLGLAQIEREQPHLGGQSMAEALYYRGFIGEGYDQVDGNLVAFVYVPSDLAAALPLHKTSYDQLDEDFAAPDGRLTALRVIDNVDEVKRADASIVDDATALLAFLQATPAPIAGHALAEPALAEITPLLLRRQPLRLAFLLGACLSANLVEIADGKAQPRRDEARAWLRMTRAEQIEVLAGAWLESEGWRDLWNVPGLIAEDSGWSYDAAAARKSAMALFSQLLPEQGWVSINDLIERVKEYEPDFQRVDGDYDSWYIQNEAGEYLTGFESWDAVEGALIEFLLMGPMRWLGLADIGADAARLTAYGRAFLEFCDWPQVEEPPARIEIRADGGLLVSRHVNRFERFQLARFARCLEAGDPYVYMIEADSIRNAAAQGITTRQIAAFIQRHAESQALPAPLLALLRNWQAGPRAAVSLEQVIVLRATSEETLDTIYAAPALRRRLGARLGPLACVVRADQWEALRDKLGEQAVEVDVSGLADSERQESRP